jgi:polar amino acid transport system substrate-binding protein
MFATKSHRRRIFFSVAITALMVLVSVALNLGTGRAQEGCRIVAGYEQDPPYHYQDEQGKVIGIDADILRIVLNDVGCQLVFAISPWKRTLSGVRTGKLDTAPGASFKDERAKWAHYSIPYRGQPHVVFENRLPGTNATSLSGYLRDGHTVGVVLGWHYTDKIRKLIDDPAYRPLVEVAPDFETVIRMHGRGRFEGFLANPSSVANTMGKQRLNETYRMINADIDILHFLFSKVTVDADLVSQFNERLAERFENGFFFDACKEYEHLLISSCDLLSTNDPATGN